MCQRVRAELAEGEARTAHGSRTKSSDAPELAPITGRVKWFDATRGFGFLVSDDVEGDILLHFSVLREHGRRSVPEGAVIECVPVKLERGLQAKESFRSTSRRPCRSSRARPCPPAERADRKALVRRGRRVRAGGGQMVQSRAWLWLRQAARRSRAARTCSSTWKRCGTAHLRELQPGQMLEARIAPSGKGLTAVELRAIGELPERTLAAAAAACSLRAARRLRRNMHPVDEARADRACSKCR